MWRHLLDIYEESRLNEGKPECLFAETLIFNEGWLLRSVLQAWKTNPRHSSLPFLPFPAGARVYSEGQLLTPFKARYRGDDQAEAHTHVDGVAGHFSIATGTKSGVKLDPGCQYIAVFEAKLYSPVAKGTKKAKDYDQVSRTAACLVHALLETEPMADCAVHLAVLYPVDNLAIDPGNYSKDHIRDQIAKRLKAYREAGDSTPEIERFEAGWEGMLERVQVDFVTWEEVLQEIGDEGLHRFYKLCKKFNATSPDSV